MTLIYECQELLSAEAPQGWMIQWLRRLVTCGL